MFLGNNLEGPARAANVQAAAVGTTASDLCFLWTDLGCASKRQRQKLCSMLLFLITEHRIGLAQNLDCPINIPSTMKINAVALYMAMLSPLSVDGFNFRSSDPTAADADADVSSILERLTSLEDTIVSLHKTVESQGNQILNQQRQIEVLESNVKSERSLMDDECFLSFFNETGTPECKVNYQLSAGKTFELFAPCSR